MYFFLFFEQTLPGMQLLSGGIKIEKPEEDLHGIYASSRIIVVAWSILFTSFIISEDNGFDYRGALLAWVSTIHTPRSLLLFLVLFAIGAIGGRRKKY